MSSICLQMFSNNIQQSMFAHFTSKKNEIIFIWKVFMLYIQEITQCVRVNCLATVGVLVVHFGESVALVVVCSSVKYI